MQSATALAGWTCTKLKAHPVGELRLLGKPRRLNELCFCAALNCRFQVLIPVLTNTYRLPSPASYFRGFDNCARFVTALREVEGSHGSMARFDFTLTTYDESDEW